MIGRLTRGSARRHASMLERRPCEWGDQSPRGAALRRGGTRDGDGDGDGGGGPHRGASFLPERQDSVTSDRAHDPHLRLQLARTMSIWPRQQHADAPPRRPARAGAVTAAGRRLRRRVAGRRRRPCRSGRRRFRRRLVVEFAAASNVVRLPPHAGEMRWRSAPGRPADAARFPRLQNQRCLFPSEATGPAAPASTAARAQTALPPRIHLVVPRPAFSRVPELSDS